MLKALAINWAVLAAAFAITSWALEGVTVSGGFLGYVWVAAIFGVVNAIVGTLLRILTLPLTIITLGLFSFVVTAALLAITDGLTQRFDIDEFLWTAIWAAVIMAVASVVLNLVLRLVLR